MRLDEIRRLNPREIASWPLIPKLGTLFLLFLLLLGAGYWFVWQHQIGELDAAKKKEDELRTTFLEKKKKAINLDAYRKQLADIEQSFGALLKQLPNKSEMDALLTDINQAGLGRGLQFELFRPASQESMSDFYAELPITLKVSGNYHDMGAFASDVAQLPRIVTLNDLSISAAKDGSLTMDAIAKTYRYLDEDELARQKKAIREKAARERAKK
ncbi:MAG: type 4a pilus biogenesis protein PilO [Burkholderiales bacterium]|nr:type 4a pilus biogenesis protein PilO [Burkholderiales bacterium]